MSVAPTALFSVFNPLPLYIGLFCLIWSFAFVVGKISISRKYAPLILLTARFLLAGILILGDSRVARRSLVAVMARRGRICDFGRCANNTLYLGFGYAGCRTVSAGLGGLVVTPIRYSPRCWPRRFSAKR